MRHERFGYGDESSINSMFKIMNYSSDDWFQTKNHLPGCANIKCESCEEQYIIKDNWLETSFEKGEVLLSYMGIPLDDNGDIMVPDNADLFTAISFHLDMKFFWQDYRKSKQTADLRAFQVAKQEREQAIGTARSALQIPDAKSFGTFLNEVWFKHSGLRNFDRRSWGETRNRVNRRRTNHR